MTACKNIVIIKFLMDAYIFALVKLKQIAF